jgi:NAD(P)-dependent dehydrogenase (short-subunit alcohol dehydrogenase family)
MGRFDAKVALITGGASGIGRAVGTEIARRGGLVCLGDLDEGRVGEAAESIRQAGGRAVGDAVDVTDAGAVGEWIARCARDHGRLDYTFNNAGIAITGEARHHTLDHWYRTLDVNLRGVVNAVHAAYPIMVEQGFGHIVNTASVAGLSPTPGFAAYVASKHAVVGLSGVLRAEGAGLGVRCSVVCPGVIETPLMYSTTILQEEKIPGGRAEILRRLPFKPMNVERCAEVILRGVERNQAIIVPTLHAKAFWAMTRFSPALAIRLSGVVAARVRREFLD